MGIFKTTDKKGQRDRETERQRDRETERGWNDDDDDGGTEFHRRGGDETEERARKVEKASSSSSSFSIRAWRRFGAIFCVRAPRVCSASASTSGDEQRARYAREDSRRVRVVQRRC